MNMVAAKDLAKVLGRILT
uniref:Uncharacterized protein n=1 Tax=Arundo donax TaxID=35708 RepID=A0A0A9ETR4_ARUDO